MNFTAYIVEIDGKFVSVVPAECLLKQLNRNSKEKKELVEENERLSNEIRLLSNRIANLKRENEKMKGEKKTEEKRKIHPKPLLKPLHPKPIPKPIPNPFHSKPKDDSEF